jgi:tetratricopeptide (TPR) repeat protein
MTTLRISCFAALAIAAFGSMPASAATDVNVLCQARDPAIAIPACTQAINSNPTLASAYYTRGRIHHAQGNLELAFADLSKAVKLAPQNDDYFFTLGDINGDIVLQSFVAAKPADANLNDGYSRAQIKWDL